MSITLKWLGHASFKISHEDKVIYIDPWQITGETRDATLVLVSHSHYDHFSPEDIEKISAPGTKLIAPADVIAKQAGGVTIMPEQIVHINDISVQGVAAYNPHKQFHPKKNNWLGFIIQIDSKRIYYAGDSDFTEEMKAVSEIDVALLPVGGTYTMSHREAAETIDHIKPKLAIPYHWGEIVGSIKDAEQFAKEADCDVKILTQEETFTIEWQSTIQT
jgi:L-ascorbate metabolism protein UlaG (beta-lactamase superfamily)